MSDYDRIVQGTYPDIVQAHLTATRGRSVPVIRGNIAWHTFLASVAHLGPLRDGKFLGSTAELDWDVPRNQIWFINDEFPDRSVRLTIEPDKSTASLE